MEVFLSLEKRYYSLYWKKVTVHCTGYGKNGDRSLKFWSTRDPGQELFSFDVGLKSVIPAWDEQVARMVCLLMNSFSIEISNLTL